MTTLPYRRPWFPAWWTAGSLFSAIVSLLWLSPQSADGVGIYTYSVIATNGDPRFRGGFENIPSINDHGQVSFVGRSGSSSTTESVFLYDPKGPVLTNISISRNFSRFQAINNEGFVVAQDLGSAGGIVKTFIRLWSHGRGLIKVSEAGVTEQIIPLVVNWPIATAYYYTLVQGLFGELTDPPPVIESVRLAFDVVYAPAVNNRGDVAFVGTGGRPGALSTVAMFWDASTQQVEPLLELPASTVALRPSVSDTGDVVFRTGDLETDPIILFRKVDGRFRPYPVAAQPHFRRLGQWPAISPDGVAVVFFGDLTPEGAEQWTRVNSEVVPVPLASGPGIFLSTVLQGQRRLLRVAGVGERSGAVDPGERHVLPDGEVSGPDFNFDGRADLNIASLEPDARLRVSSLQPFRNPDAGSHLWVVYGGTDNATNDPQPAVFVSRANFIRYRTSSGEPRTFIGAEPPNRVLMVGDTLPRIGRITNLGGNYDINALGEVVFWAAAGSDSQGIFKATPRRTWLLSPTSGVPGLPGNFVEKINKRTGFDPDSPLVEYIVPGIPGNSRRVSTNHIVLHATVSQRIGGLVKMAGGNGPQPGKESIHYLITREGQVIQILPEAAVANHASNPGHPQDQNANPHSIGIELIDDCQRLCTTCQDCTTSTGHRNNPDWLTSIQAAKTALLVRDICRRHNIPLRLASPFPGEHYKRWPTPRLRDETQGDRYAREPFQKIEGPAGTYRGLDDRIDEGFSQGNGNPRAYNDSAVTDLTSPVRIPVTANDADDSDPNNSLTPVLAPKLPPTYGTVRVDGNSIIYTPRPGLTTSVTDSFGYQVRDTQGARSASPATVTVTLQPDATPAHTTPAVTTAQMNQRRTTIRVRDGFGPSYRGVITHGQVLNRTIAKDDPSPRQARLSSAQLRPLIESRAITLQVPAPPRDDRPHPLQLASAPALAAEEEPDPPPTAEESLNDDTLVTLVGTPVSFHLLGNDVLSEETLMGGEVLILEPPAHGIATLDEEFPGLVTYEPQDGFAGADTFTYTVSREHGSDFPPVRATVLVHPPDVVADVTIAQSTSPAEIRPGDDITWTVLISNLGPAAASNVVATLAAPSGSSWLSNQADRGVMIPHTTGFRLELGTLTDGESVRWTLVLRTPPTGEPALAASVVSSTPERHPQHDTVVHTLPTLTETEQPPRLRLQRASDGPFLLELIGSAGISYEIESSTNLLDWSPWTTVTPTQSPMPVDPRIGMDAPWRFYRGKTSP